MLWVLREDSAARMWGVAAVCRDTTHHSALSVCGPPSELENVLGRKNTFADDCHPFDRTEPMSCIASHTL